MVSKRNEKWGRAEHSKNKQKIFPGHRIIIPTEENKNNFFFLLSLWEFHSRAAVQNLILRLWHTDNKPGRPVLVPPLSCVCALRWWSCRLVGSSSKEKKSRLCCLLLLLLLFYFILFFWIQRVNRARAYKMNSFSLFSPYLTGFRVCDLSLSSFSLFVNGGHSKRWVSFVVYLFYIYIRYVSLPFRSVTNSPRLYCDTHTSTPREKTKNRCIWALSCAIYPLPCYLLVRTDSLSLYIKETHGTDTRRCQIKSDTIPSIGHVVA